MRAPETALSILHLEDSVLDADLTASFLHRGGIQAVLTRVQSRDEFLRGLAAGPDLVLADYALPSFNGVEALDLTRQQSPDLPFIFVSGVLGEEVAIDTLKRGATDYVLKRRLERLAPAIRRAFAEAREKAERRRIEERLRYQLRLTDVIARQAAEALFLMDRSGQVTFLNPAAEKLFGWSLQELAGRKLHDVIHHPGGPGAAPPDCPLARVLEQGQPVQNHEDLFYCRDGSALPVLVSNAVVQEAGDGAGRVQGTVLVVTDITDRKQMEEELRRRAEALTENDRRKDQFLAMLAHELRNPLAPITHAAEVLKKLRPGDAELRGPCELISRQVGNLVRLVDDLLDVSRITRGKIVLQEEPIDLNAVVARAVETSRPLIDAREHHLTVELPHEPIRVLGDLTRLAQCLSNLLNNAAKYTLPRGNVVLRVERQGDEAVLRVGDNGVGIPPEVLPHVFDLFIQGSQSLARSDGGLGVGLTLVRTLVQMQGGRVSATSAGPGRGSEFAIHLPALPADRHPTSDLSGDSLDGWADRLGVEADELPPVPVATRRILIVDDRPDNLESLGMVLTVHGHEVSMAHDGPSALQAASAFRPEVVLLDLGLPGMNGYEVARRLRQQPDGKHLFIAAMTGYGMDEDRRRSQEAGMDAHLVKPIDWECLEQLLTPSAGPKRE